MVVCFSKFACFTSEKNAGMFVHFIAVSSSLQGQTDLHSPVQARLVPEQRIEIAWQCQAVLSGQDP
jgi:hypothetical protein